MPGSGGECAARQQRMIVSLHDNERIALGILRRYVPGLLGVAVPSAQPQAAALAERIERESLVGPEPLSGGRFDGPGGPGEEARQKLAKRALADEADAGAVGLVEYRQPGRARAPAPRPPRRAGNSSDPWRRRAPCTNPCPPEPPAAGRSARSRNMMRPGVVPTAAPLRT